MPARETRARGPTLPRGGFSASAAPGQGSARGGGGGGGVGSPRVGGPRRALVTPGRPGGRAPEEGGSGQRKRPGAHGSPAPARRAAVPLCPAAQRGLRARGLRGSSSGVGACVPQPRARLALPRPGTSAVCRVSRGSASVRCVRPRRNSEARPQGGRNRGACTPARPPPRRAACPRLRWPGWGAR